jgi:hypothetical protein
VLASVLLYVVGSLVAFGADDISGLSVLNFALEAAAAGLLLGTRHPRWADLLVGLLAWEWLAGVEFLHWQFRRDFNGWGFLLLGSATGVAALLCLVVGAWRRPTRPTVAGWIFAVILTIVGFFAAGYVLTLLFNTDSLESGYAIPLQLLAAVLCGLMLPGVLLARPAPSAAVLTAIGWFATGAQLAAIATPADQDNSEPQLMWALVVAATVLTLVAAAVAARRPTVAKT